MNWSIVPLLGSISIGSLPEVSFVCCAAAVMAKAVNKKQTQMALVHFLRNENINAVVTFSGQRY
jgi:hypothetical protein